MGRPPNSSSDATDSAKPSDVEDAEIVEDAAEVVKEVADDADASKAAGEETTDDATGDDAATDSDEDDADDNATIDLTPDDVDPEEPLVSDFFPIPEGAVVVKEPASPLGGGVVPLVLGGVVAALLGFLLARYGVPDGWPTPETDRSAELAAAVEAQTARADALEAALQDLATRAPDTSAVDALGGRVDRLESAQSSISERASAANDGVTGAMDSLNAISERLATLEARPIPEAFDADAFDAELKAFRADLTAAIDTAKSEIADAKAEADQIAEQAAAAAASADRQQALVGLTAALETGEPFQDVLSTLEADGFGPFPDALTSAASSGVETLQNLRERFAPAARSALDASIRANTGDGTSDRILSFLRVQTGARSLEPREGDDPDAVLSRAEAALRNGDLSAALMEIEALPEAGRDEMVDWVGAATARIAALDAAKALAGDTNRN